MADPIMWYPLDGGRAGGVTVTVIAGCLSLVSVLAVLTMMAISAYRTKESPDDYEFLRTHVAVYFVCLLLCDLTKAVGAILSIPWVVDMGITNNTLCIAQAAMKQTSNVGMALWSLVIAFDTFWLLFYSKTVPITAFYVIIISVWSFLAFVVVLGPSIATPGAGPFYGISDWGFYCWITTNYITGGYTLDCLFRLITVVFSFLFYSLSSFRLRGNIVTNGWKVSFQRRVALNKPWNHLPNAVMDPQKNERVITVARQMMWYPITYAILVVPITVTRIIDLSGVAVPYQQIIVCDTIFMLSGFADAILFTTTRRVLPANEIFPDFIRRMFGISPGTGMSTPQPPSANPPMSMHRPEAPYTDIIIGNNLETGMMRMPTDCVYQVSTSNDTRTTSERPSFL